MLFTEAENMIASMLLDDGCDYEYYIENVKEDYYLTANIKKLHRIIIDLKSRNVSCDRDTILLNIDNKSDFYNYMGTVFYNSSKFKEVIRCLKLEYTRRKLERMVTVEVKELREKEDLTDFDIEVMKNNIKTQLADLDSVTNTDIIKISDSVDSYIDYLNDYKAGKIDKGLLTGFPSLDRVTYGFKGNQFIILAALEGVGKEQPLYSKILTPSGWTTMGELKVGDIIIGDDGLETTVTGIYPQGKKDIYRLYLSDGDYADCGIEHLWRVQSYLDRQFYKDNYLVKTTKELMNSINSGYAGRKMWTIPYIKPIEYTKKEFIIDPYILGLYIGDGYLKEKMLCISNVEDDIINKFKTYIENFNCVLKTHNNKDWKCVSNNNLVSIPAKKIIELGFYKKLSYNKFIPQEYLFGSVEQRLQLLRGLLDTDGYVAHKNCSIIEYSTTSEQLKNDIIELVKSLGGRATYKSRMGSYIKNGIKKYTRINYRIYISFSNGIIPVSSKKHLAKINNTINNKSGRFIEKIEKIGEEECQCIMVNNKNHCYVTDNYIITHNTSLALAFINHWIDSKKKILFFSLEMNNNQLMQRLISIRGGIPSDVLKDTEPLPDSIKQKIIDTSLEIQNSDIFINTDMDVSVDKIMTTASKLKNKYGLDAVIIDHVGLLMLNEESGKDERTKMNYISRNLKRLSKELNIPVIVLSQFSRNSADKNGFNIPTRKSLKESGSLEQDADIVMILHRWLNNEDGSTTSISDQTKVAINFDKHRDGERRFVDTMYFDLATTTFKDKLSDNITIS